MTNEVKPKSPYVYGADADALYRTNMVECHRALHIGRQGKAAGQPVESLITSTYAITMASSGVMCLMQIREENTSATATQG